MRSVANVLVAGLLLALAVAASATSTCFDGKCTCRTDRVCLVWMTGGGGTTQDNIRARLKDMRAMFHHAVGIVILTPTGDALDGHVIAEAELQAARAMLASRGIALEGMSIQAVHDALKPFGHVYSDADLRVALDWRQLQTDQRQGC
jgi:hypothetical protein